MTRLTAFVNDAARVMVGVWALIAWRHPTDDARTAFVGTLVSVLLVLGLHRALRAAWRRLAPAPTSAPDATEEEAELREYRRHRHSTTTDRERAREQGFNEEFGEYPPSDGPR